MEIEGVIVIMLSAIAGAAIAYMFLMKKIQAVSAASVMNIISDSIPSKDSNSTRNVTNDTITSGSLSSTNSKPVALKRTYEVFLSFCGKDTRNGFTDFLYTYLNGSSIRTFRDHNELRVGEQIGSELLKAIKESKILIPILSKNYATSKWCLLELVEMVDCHKYGNHLIYPIFFDVKPSDVRNLRGSYELAFREHMKVYDKETVDKWIFALKKVGELKGLVLKNETNGHEGKLVEKVTQMILKMLKKNYTVVPKNLVGIDKHTDELKARLKVDSGGVRVVGIHGMGGLGKTTIAKATYNQLCDSFESHCFLDNVREKSKKCDGIQVLQKQLISKILNLNRGEDHSSSIEDAVYERKVLIVLDDVDDIDQVNMLMGSHSSYGAYSRIIITTRDVNVLCAIENVFRIEGLQDSYTSYKPDYMNYDDSIQLFSKFAFMRDSPIEGFERFSEEVVSIAAGLPLVLVVLGSTFFPVKDKSFWEEKLKMLRMIPEKEVRQKLNVSFEALEYEEKQIFLDIACFFIDTDIRRARYMWDDCEYFPRVGIWGLISKSLITVDDDDIVCMHDQLRALGRDIVRREGLNDFGKRSRLWRSEDALKILDTSQEAQNVEALSLPYVKLDRFILPSSFRGFPNLRYLHINIPQDLKGDFHHLFPNLRWLHWRYNRKLNPTNLHLANLVILDLSYSCLQSGEDWKGLLNQFNMGIKLKVLDLSVCDSIRALPDLSTYPSLEILNLFDCRSLCRLDGLEQLKSLKYLDVMDCEMLETLPNLSNLTSLVRLELGSKIIVEIKGLEKLESLEYLRINGCGSIERLPDLSNLTNLKHLDISECYKLIEVTGLNKLNSLEHLKLKDCVSLEGVLDTSNMCNLTELCAHKLEATTIVNLKLLQKLEIPFNETPIKFQGLDALQSLKVVGGSMRMLPDLTCLRSMKELELNSCKKLVTLEVIGELESLEKLKISNCRSIKTIVFSSCLRKLQQLYIISCYKLIGIQHLDRMESLKFIEIDKCTSLKRLPYLPNFGMLKQVYLKACKGLQVLCEHAVNESLERLHIEYCDVLREISDLNSFKNLKILVIHRLPNLCKIAGLEELKSLECLTCSNCESIKEFPKFSELHKLRILYASGCVKLRHIEGLEQLESLQYLILNGCDELGDLSYSRNTRVQHLSFREYDVKYSCGGIPFLTNEDPLTYYKKRLSNL